MDLSDFVSHLFKMSTEVNIYSLSLFFYSFNFDILLFGKFSKFVVLMSSLWWIGGKYKQSSLNLDILDNFLLVFFA